MHTINNAALVIMGLLYSGLELEPAICLTVMGGWDTDCTGATAGSIVGAIRGAKALPAKWVGAAWRSAREHRHRLHREQLRGPGGEDAEGRRAVVLGSL